MNAIAKISKRAKQLQKKKPGTAWKTHIKAASKEYRAGKLGAAPKKKIAGKKVTGKKISGLKRYKRRVNHEVATRASGAGLTIAAATHFIKSELEDKLGKAMVNQINATTKRRKREIGKTIAEYKKRLRKLK